MIYCAATVAAVTVAAVTFGYRRVRHDCIYMLTRGARTRRKSIHAGQHFMKDSRTYVLYCISTLITEPLSFINTTN